MLGLVAEAVGFYIGLVIHVEAQGIAELVEFPGLRVMAGADGVHVGQLHQLEVFQEVFPGYVVAGVGVVFVQVHALELNGLAVYQEGFDLPLSVFHGGYLQVAEAHVEAGVFSVYLQKKGVQVGRFGRPEPDARYGVRYGKDVSGELEDGICHGRSAGIQQLIKHLCGGVRVHSELEKTGLEIRCSGGDDIEIEAAVHLLAGKVYVPFQAGDAPEVLVFQPGTLGIAVNLQEEFVAPFFQEIRDAEARQVFGVFAVAHFLSVHVDVGAALGAAEVQVYLPAFPAFRNGKAAVVQGRGNRFRQHAGHGVLRAEIVSDIGIDGGAPALDFPVAGNLDLVPGLRDGHLPMVFKVFEIPGAVQAPVVLAVAESLGEGIGPFGKIDDLRALRFGIYAGGLRVLPVGEDGG